MKHLTLILALASMNACASTTNCESPTNQMEMNLCISQQLSNVESELKEVIDSMPKEITQDSAFISAANSWAQYREDHCASVSEIYASGSIYNYALSSCKIEMTQRRVDTLLNDYKDTISIIKKGAP